LITYYTNRTIRNTVTSNWIYIHAASAIHILLDAEPLHPADELVDLLGRVQVLGDTGALGAA
jgi:hypothetical protein